jgi:purine-cytosine permease-like protein
MKLVTFNWVISGLAMIGLIGFLVFRVEFLLALGIIFGVWFLINVVEFFLKKYFRRKPIRMVEE